MYYQKEKGIYVYRQHTHDGIFCNHTKIRAGYYKSLDDFLNTTYTAENFFDEIGYKITDTKCDTIVKETYKRGCYGQLYVSTRTKCGEINCTVHPRIYDGWNRSNHVLCVVYDENGKQYLPDELVGLHRNRKPKRTPNRWERRTQGRSKRAYGGYRSVRTFQERKVMDAWNDEEHVPKFRRRWLPTSWDDIHAHSDKSWKTQNKRKHQWK